MCFGLGRCSYSIGLRLVGHLTSNSNKDSMVPGYLDFEGFVVWPNYLLRCSRYSMG